MKCLQCGRELTTGDGLNMICQECNQKNQQPVLFGWICPRCGKVHSPFVTECGCPPPSITSAGVVGYYGTEYGIKE